MRRRAKPVIGLVPLALPSVAELMRPYTPRPKPLKKSAERVARWRARQKEGREPMVVAPRTALIESMIEHGLFDRRYRDDKRLCAEAVQKMLDLMHDDILRGIP